MNNELQFMRSQVAYANYVLKASYARSFKDREGVKVLLLCEPARLMLRPNVRYEFVVDENCAACVAANEPYAEQEREINDRRAANRTS